MGTVTKRQVAEKVAQLTGQTQVVAKQVTQLFFDEIINELATGNRLEFRDFGVFEVVTRRPRTGRNPRTGERVAVPLKRAVTFKMGKAMRERVSSDTSPSPVSETVSSGPQISSPPGTTPWSSGASSSPPNVV